MTTRPLHADIVLNHWAEHYQELLGRVVVDFESRPDLAEQWLGEFANCHDGSYLFVTEPHNPSDCPFLGKNRLDMIYEKVNPDEFNFEPGRPIIEVITSEEHARAIDRGAGRFRVSKGR